MIRKTLIAIGVILVALQFYRPARNLSSDKAVNHIAVKYAVPEDVQAILRNSCYDCHSNNTRYPWYAEMQPLGWWLQHHVDEGKAELNFDEFLGYTPKKAHHKLEEVIEQVRDDEMPLEGYVFVHRNAALSDPQKKSLEAWASATMEIISKEGGLDAGAEGEKRREGGDDPH